MFKKNKSTKSKLVGIAAASGLFVGLVASSIQPANAQGFFGNFFGFGGSDQVAGDYNLVSNNMRTSLANTANQLNSAASSGQLDPQESSMAQARLNNLNSMFNNMAADGVYTTGEVEAFIAEQRSLGDQIQSFIANGNAFNTFGNGINGWNNGWNNGFNNVGFGGNPYKKALKQQAKYNDKLAAQNFRGNLNNFNSSRFPVLNSNSWNNRNRDFRNWNDNRRGNVDRGRSWNRNFNDSNRSFTKSGKDNKEWKSNFRKGGKQKNKG